MRLEAVGKRYGPRAPWVVRDVSAQVQAGRLIRLEGRNGSGKSTLLKVIAGVCLPSAGRVRDRPHVGYVPERFPGGLPFSAREYLLHMARVHGLAGAPASARVDEWLERLGAAPYAQAPLRSLSKGMCQKVAVAQALLPGAGLLVLDEAWTGLDASARRTLDAAATSWAATAAGAGVLLGLAGAVFEVLTSESVARRPAGGLAAKATATLVHPGVLVAGLAVAVVCVLVGSAAGTLCNPPLIRHPGMAVLSTLCLVVLALASGVSPAAAALRNRGGAGTALPHWPGAVPVLASVCLAAVTWTAAAMAAARRDSRATSGG